MLSNYHRLAGACVIFLLFNFPNFARCNPNGGLTTRSPPSLKSPGTTRKDLPTSSRSSTSARAAAIGHEANIHGIYMLDPAERFCHNIPSRPFYLRATDGAVCCRGKQLPVVTLVPEATGECAISTKTDANGMLDSENLIDKDGKIVPSVFFTYLSDGLTEASKNRIRTVMTANYGCFRSMKNSISPCHTAWSFQKCYLDALYFICSFGIPKAEDVAKIKKLSLDYEKLTPACSYNRRKTSPGCCHGKPMPWTVMEIMEAANNETKNEECMNNMGADCDATCFLNSIGAVNSDMEIDVGVFQKQVLQHFPVVKASSWMDYIGPVFLFYDEVLADMGDESSDTPHRVCRFHDRILELHESKVDEYCSMTPEEVKEVIKNTPISG